VTDPDIVYVELSDAPDGDEHVIGRPARVVVRGTPAWRALVVGALAAATAALVLAGLALPVGEARLVSRFVAVGVALIGLQFVVGDAGQLSLCHGAFVGVGSYATVIGVTRGGLPVWLSVALAPVAGFAAGALVGTLAVRLRATYLGPVTLSVAVVFPMVVKRFSWLTGGSNGMPLTPMRAPSWLGVAESRPYFWNHLVIVAFALVALVVARNVRSSQVGLAVRSVAGNPLSAATSGVHVTRTRIVSYAWGAGFGALGGGLLVVDTPIVGADNFDLFRSLGYYAAVMVGGAASLLGAAIGALLLVVVPRLVEVFELRVGTNMVLGVLLVASTLLAPTGLAQPLRERLEAWLDVRDPLDPRAAGTGGRVGRRPPPAR
jgi:branched-chain amino acid transport system permease protein